MGSKYFVVILLGGLCLSSFADPLFPNAQCAELLRAMVLKPLSDDQTKLLETMAAELGMRVADGVEMDADGTLRFPDAAHGAIRIRFVPGLTEPRFSEGLLELPPGTRLAKLSDGGKALLRRTFLGHRLYPFLVDKTGPHVAERIARGEPGLVHREIQRDVIEVGRALLDAFAKQGRPEDQSLLAVSPTGTGKSEMVRALLRHRLTQCKRGLLIVMSDYGAIVDQLSAEVVKVNNGTANEAPLPLRIIRWGDGQRQEADAKNLAELTELARTSDLPVVLVTTAASFRTQIGAKKSAGSEEEFEIDAEKLAALRAQLRYWVYDEAHHAGAMQIGRIFDGSMHDNPNATALLVTATPDVRVQKMAGGRGFYTYLDRPQSWLGDRKSAARTPGEAVLQLRAAFDAGDLVGFDEVRPLIFARTSGEEVFKGVGAGTRPELDEGHYGSLYMQTRKALETRSTLVSVNSQREALRVAGDLQRRLVEKNRVVAVYTSEFEGTISFHGSRVVVKPANDLLDRFRRGEIHVLVSVDRVNEGVDLPIASALIDLRNNPDPTALLQRLGRLTRTAPGKRDTEVYLAQAKTKEDLIVALDNVARSAKTAQAYRVTPQGDLVIIATGEMLPRVLEANRLDFWNANASRGITSDTLESYQPLFRAVMKTFQASADFNRVTDRLRSALPESNRAEWDRELAVIRPQTYMTDASIAKTDLHAAERVVRVLDLYARLQGITVPESGFREVKEFESLLARFGYIPSIASDEVTSYLPLMNAITATFKATKDFSRVTDALRAALPETKQGEWNEVLKRVQLPILTMTSAGRGGVASTERVVWVLEFYARLQGVPESKSRFREPREFEPLLARFGYTTFVITDDDRVTYAPLLENLTSTFAASAKFSRVLEEFRAALPAEKLAEWDRDLQGISPKFREELLKAPSNADAAQVVRVVELYARLQGIEGAESHFRESKDIGRLLAPFGYSSFSVTPEDAPTYLPLIQAVTSTFSAANDFQKVVSSLRDGLPEKHHEEWDRSLKQISSKLSGRLLQSAKQGYLKPTEDCVRVIELYAKLKGIPIPKNHFRESKDIERLLAPFGYSGFSVTPEDAPTYLPLIRAVMSTFSAANDFQKVVSSLRDALPEKHHEEWDRSLKQIPSELSGRLLQSANQGRLKPTEDCVRVIELYAKLKGIPIPENHFRDEKDYEPLLAPFRKR